LEGGKRKRLHEMKMKEVRKSFAGIEKEIFDPINFLPFSSYMKKKNQRSKQNPQTFLLIVASLI
jgi:hypothetical protein